MRLDVLNVFRSTEPEQRRYRQVAADAQGVSVDRANVSAWMRTVLNRSVSQRRLARPESQHPGQGGDAS